MIISEHKRRWLEVRFFYFCHDLYLIRKNMLDVMYAIETMSQIGEFKVKDIKIIAGKVTSDPYYMPSQDEFILLAHLNELSYSEISKYLEKSKSTIAKTVQRKLEEYYPYPRLTVDEDIQINEFFKIVDLFKKAGI